MTREECDETLRCCVCRCGDSVDDWEVKLKAL